MKNEYTANRQLDLLPMESESMSSAEGSRDTRALLATTHNPQ